MTNVAAPLRKEIEELAVSQIAQVFYAGRDHPRLLPFWFGEGDTPTPDFVKQAAIRAIGEDKVFYVDDRGIPRLREAISRYATALHGREIAVDRVQVTASGMSAVMMTMQAISGPGDNVVYLSPVWPNIVEAVRICGATPRPVSLDATPDGGWRLDLQKLFASCDARTRGIFVASPGNPTGWMMDAAEIAELLAFCRRRRIWLVVDAVYERLTYGTARAPSPLDVAERDDPVISLNSFSKAWAMTGWRLGWVIAPAWVNLHLRKLNQYNTSGAATFVQWAGIAALDQGEPFIDELRGRLQRARDLVIQGLSRFPRVHVAAPPGAFYAFFRVDGLGDGLAFAKEMVARTGVGLAPGTAFGAEGEGYLRFCYASSEQRLSDALARMEPMLR
ncbi:MAG: aminotransferase class I/II-fold pyridoxal phosphate-dependent enzyme [Alphaproteobacteria bacterium]|nr:aminotransferase class I/II-fold pyridoxal phosphate-dependent enzyme [Alphaproteobacteria bacterium]